MSMHRVGVYPGTFDPITFGHLDIIRRAGRMVDQLVVAVARNAGKGPLFSVDERVEMVRDETQEIAQRGGCGEILVRPFDNLLMHFCRSVGGTLIVRGLRAVSDFEYEFQMAGMNAHLDPNVETAFLMASERTQFISSRFVKEIGRLGGAIGDFVPERVRLRLEHRFSQDTAGNQRLAKQTGPY
ncbi:MAG: pantetheine-phosphate adenylyltransferase [Thalassobaculales bacterium]